MRKPGFWHVFCVFLFAISNCVAQKPVVDTSRLVTPTRLVVQFRDLEKQWLEAIHNRDEAKLNELMGEDFQVFSAGSDPQPKEEWLKTALAAKPVSYRIGGMSVRDLGGPCVASFVLSEPSGDSFVVDVWQKQGERWEATDRYISKIAGTRRTAVQRPVRPTGKD